MLTKTDLKEIDKIVSKRINKTEEKLLATEKRLTKRIDVTEEKLLATEKRLTEKIGKIDNKLDKAIDFLDRDYLKLLKRLERVEKHLGLEPLTV